MKIIPARPRLRRHRHAPCDRQDILRKRVWIGIGRELAAGFEALKPLALLDPAWEGYRFASRRLHYISNDLK